jgi:hypothetical protein
MSTCAELPQLGCCDEDDEQLVNVGFYRITLSTDRLPEASITPGQLPAIFGRMRRWLAAQDMPGEGLTRIMRYSVVDDLVSDVATVLADPPLDPPRVPFALTFPNNSTVLAAILFGSPRRWHVFASRYMYRLPKANSPIYPTAQFPACVWTRRLGVDTCIQSRLVVPTGDAFGIDPVTGKGGYRWRVLDMGDSLLFESNGADENGFTPEELTLTSQGLSVSHTQGWRFVDEQGAPGGADGAPCCDLSPLAP